jgi:hypothetical protein
MIQNVIAKEVIKNDLDEMYLIRYVFCIFPRLS